MNIMIQVAHSTCKYMNAIRSNNDESSDSNVELEQKLSLLISIQIK